MITHQTRQDLVSAARELLEEWNQVHPGNCLYAAEACRRVAPAFGIELTIVAGSSHWPATYEGDTLIFFSYIWEGLKKAMPLMRKDKLPEIHVWNRAHDGSVVDITTRNLPVQAKKTAKLTWTLPDPPDFVWTRRLPRDVRYLPDREATHAAETFLLRMLASGELPKP